jgi:Domain of unknown function (DUF4129)
MGTRRLLPLAFAVAGLLALAALASHGRPFTTSHGNGPAAGFFDYVFTTIVLVAVAIAVVAVVAAMSTRAAPLPRRPPPKGNLLRSLVLLAIAVLIATLIGHARLRLHLHSPRPATNAPAAHGRPARGTTPHGRAARLRWDEVAIVAALLAALGIAALASRRTHPPPEWPLRSHEEVALALDESLDDLRTEPDLRKAIIAAYARMERALAAAGIPRRPSEAPFEYLERALYALDASAPAITRLTDLFERAKFSQHEPDPAMRDEAIDALVAIRDELRRPAAAAA